jgi:DNA modification methylase
MTLKLDAVHQGDCVELMNQIDAGSVDLAFADPPFNIGYKYDVYDDRQTYDDYLSWSRDWISGVHRILKDDGAFWLAIGDEFAAELKIAAQDIGFHTRSWVIWYYTFGVNCKNKFTRSHAHIYYFVKDPKKFAFNADDEAIRIPSARMLVYGDKRANPKGRLPDDTWILRPQDFPEGFQPTETMWYYSRVAGTFSERQGFHGCQMPEQLLGRIVRACSNQDDIVFDPFSGSGTTLAVAKKLGRHYLGTELSEDYATQVAERLERINVGDQLDGPADPLISAPQTSKGKKVSDRKPGKPRKKKRDQLALPLSGSDAGA